MVRVCDVTYDKAPLEKDGITVVVRASGSGGTAAGVGLGVWAPLGGGHVPCCLSPAPPPASRVGARAM